MNLRFPPKINKYMADPTAKQLALLAVESKEVLYGGAAGGGKSFGLLLAALQYVDVPGYAALLLRRTFADLCLPGAWMDQSHELLDNTDAEYHEQGKTWRFPTGAGRLPATLTFGYLESDKDKFRYQSSMYQFVGYDELTQFHETQYTYLFSRLRRVHGNQAPLRMRAASNPGGVGHDWVKQRFMIEGPAAGRIFIPSSLADNEHIDRESYIESLAELDPTTRAQLLHGDWTARHAGSMFKREWFGFVDEPPAEGDVVRYWDLAATAPRAGSDPDSTSGAKMWKTIQGTYIIEDVQNLLAESHDVERRIRQTADMDGTDCRIAMEQEGGASGKSLCSYYHRQVLPEYSFRAVPSTGSKSARAMPLASQAEAGNVKLVRGAWNRRFLDQVEQFPTQGVHDDDVDSAAGAFHALQQPRPVRARVGSINRNRNRMATAGRRR